MSGGLADNDDVEATVKTFKMEVGRELDLAELATVSGGVEDYGDWDDEGFSSAAQQAARNQAMDDAYNAAPSWWPF
jgi:hypothetical protein